MTRVDIAVLGSDGSVGGPGGSPLSPSGLPTSAVKASSAGAIPAWTSATAYGVNQLVSYGGMTLICKTAHTSGSTFTGVGVNWALVRGSLIEAATPTYSLRTSGCAGNGNYVADAAIAAGSNQLSSAWAISTPYGRAPAAGMVALVVGAGTPTSVGTTSGALSTGAAITTIPCNALANAIPQGDIFIFSADGTQSQRWATTGAAAAATTIPVASQTPSFAFASGSTIGYPECLSTTISSVAGGVATLAVSAAVSQTAVIACYGTDDTAAIQAILDTLGNNGIGGRVIVEDATFCVAGPLKTVATSGNNLAALLPYYSQLTLPAQNVFNAPELIINLEAGRAAGGDPTLEYGLQTTGAIFQSFLVGQTAGANNQAPAILGGPAVESQIATIPDVINVCFTTKNITYRCPSNPSLGGLNLQCVERAEWENTCIDTTEVPHAYASAPIYPIQPVHPSGIAFSAPGLFCQSGRSRGDFFITGYYCGLRLGEHTAIDYCYTLLNYVSWSWQNAAHACTVAHINTEHQAYGLAKVDPTLGVNITAPVGGVLYVACQLWDIEDNISTALGLPAFSRPVSHIYDPQQRAHGVINFHRVVANTGAIATPTPLTETNNNTLVLTNNGQSVRGGAVFGFSTTSTAGSASALPATPAVYFTVYDQNGLARKIPAYNT